MVTKNPSKISIKTNSSNLKLTLVHLTENLYTLSIKYFGNTAVKPVLVRANKERHYTSVSFENIELSTGTKLNKKNTSLKQQSYTIKDIEVSKSLGYIFELN